MGLLPAALRRAVWTCEAADKLSDARVSGDRAWERQGARLVYSRKSDERRRDGGKVSKARRGRADSERLGVQETSRGQIVLVPFREATACSCFTLPSQRTCLLILQVLEEWQSHRVSVRSSLRLSKPFYLPQIHPNSSQFLYSKSITTFCKSEINSCHYPELTLGVLCTSQLWPWYDWRAISKQMRTKTWRS